MPRGHNTDRPARKPRAAHPPREASTVWADPENVRLLKQWWEEGWTQAAIAKRLGVTSSAISGKISRLGIARRNPTPPVDRRNERRRALRIAAKSDAKPETVAIPVRNVAQSAPLLSSSIPFEKLTLSTCRWPIGDGVPEWRFCGCAVHKGAYCEAHGRLAYVPVKRRQPILAEAAA